MAPRWVIKCLDIVEDGKLGVTAAGWDRFLEAGLGLERAPKRLHGGVIVAIAGPAHAAFDAGLGQCLEVVFIDVLAPSVRVMEQPVGRLPTPECVLECGQDQAGVQGRAASPANDPAAPDIEDCRKEQPAFGSPQVGDVRHPGLIGSGRGRTQGQKVFRHGLTVATVCGAGMAPMLLPAAQALRPHQARTAPPARAGALFAQILDDAGRSVVAPTGPVGRGDLNGQIGILTLPGAGPVQAPTVVAAG